MAKKKVAVLGGGCGAMAAAWSITQVPNWQDDYELTVYQMGWRLGGKGASGRNADAHQRIEEHGLHVWGGFYENAFNVMKEAYAAVDRPPGAPLRTWQDAFKPHHDVVMEEFIEGQWRHWEVNYPDNDEVPGTGGLTLEVSDYIEMVLEEVWDHFTRSPFYADLDEEAERLSFIDLLKAGTGVDNIKDWRPGSLLRGAWHLAKTYREANNPLTGVFDVMVEILDGVLDRMRDEFYDQLDDNDEIRRLYLILDITINSIRGLIADGALTGGFAAIDKWEWIEWMERHGVSEYTLRSVLVRGIYDYVFGYMNGDTQNPSCGAGTAIHGVLRLVFTYKGAVFYYMQAGMGDVVFGPMYEALAERGVTFKFFHRVERLELDAGEDKVHKIHMTKQAKVTAGDDAYEPLVDVKGLPCWPSKALYAQLDEGAQLEANGTNLESPYDPWAGVGSVTLELGADFDEVILGIPPTCFEHIARELMDANPAFDEMVKALPGVATMCAQVWLNEDAPTIGAPTKPVIASGYTDPLNTWCDLTHLIPREEWGVAEPPKMLAYFCGPYEPSTYVAPPFSDHEYPARERVRAHMQTLEYFAAATGHIWEKAGARSQPAGLRYGLLYSPNDHVGPHRWKDQYIRVNVDPSELYILSPPGSTAKRLRADGSGFENVYLAGDWVLTSLTAGCVECAVMAGMHAAEGLTGHRLNIIGRAY